MHRFLSSTLFRSWSSRFCLPDSPIWLYLGLWNWTHVGVWSTPPSIHASHLSALCISTSSSQHPKPGATHTLLSFPCAGHQQSLAIYLLPKYIEILTSLNPFLTKSSPNHCLLSWLLKLGLTSQLGSSGHSCLPVEDCCLGKMVSCSPFNPPNTTVALISPRSNAQSPTWPLAAAWLLLSSSF